MEQSAGGGTGNTIAVRRDILSLAPWDETVLWYARAIAAMQQRSIKEPTSWLYQAAIHGHEPESERSQYWNQCQHGSSFFLPWHRGYIAWFEQTVAATIKQLKGPSSWALPYWNYSSKTETGARCLPRAFRERQMPDGEPNPLYIAERNPGVNEGDPVGDEEDVSLAALKQLVFEGPGQGGNTGFGGPATGFHHPAGRAGALEARPHNTIHVDVGGWMASFSTAARDPIFWLHHANIDRLWEIWRKEPGRSDPSRREWLDFPFDLHNGEGAPIKFTPREMLKTTAPPLSYEYDELTIPPPTAAAARPVAVAASQADVPEQPPKPSQEPPEMVGATAQPLTLTTEPGETELPISEPTGPIAQTLAAEPEAVRIYLNVENVLSERPAMSYGVYLNVPKGADPREHPDLLAGVLAPFGSERASRPDDPHGGTGLHFTFDVTHLVAEQRAAGTWNPNTARVAFVPRSKTPDPAPLEVGRVSLYYHR
jgi:tyrosinase